MKKWLVAMALLLGLAMATGGNGDDAWAVSGGDDLSVAVDEVIKLKIPVRYALHLDESLWELDLSEPPAGVDYVFNPNDPQPPEEGCYLVPKFVTTIEDLGKYAAKGELFRGIDTYPAIRDFNGDGEITGDEKGTLICVNHKLIQKFSNDPDGWKLTVDVTGNPTTGFGYFGMADILPFGLGGYFYTDTLPVSDQEIASGSGPTGGWLDDLIVEGFWFDGSEAAGDYELTVTFTLAGL